MAVRFTSGPYEARRFGAIHGGPVHQFENGSSRLQIGLAMLTEDMEPAERDANARLWAQAPAMYALLKRALGIIREQRALAESIRIVLTKVEGETK